MAPASAFFSCFSEKSVQSPDGVSYWDHGPFLAPGLGPHPSKPMPRTLPYPCAQDAGACRRAAQECAPLMAKYDVCMAKVMKKRPQKLIRVQEEYRMATPATGAGAAKG
ncbi:unnamed protein product [Phaeothamnion confervicola]